MFSLVSDKHSVHTRNNVNEINVPAYKLNISHGNIKYRGSIYFNSIPMDIINLASYPIFKQEMKKVRDFTVK